MLQRREWGIAEVRELSIRPALAEASRRLPRKRGTPAAPPACGTSRFPVGSDLGWRICVKGFALDDERLKGRDPIGDHFDELLARIRDIRASEQRAYQRVWD